MWPQAGLGEAFLVSDIWEALEKLWAWEIYRGVEEFENFSLSIMDELFRSAEPPICLESPLKLRQTTGLWFLKIQMYAEMVLPENLGFICFENLVYILEYLSFQN